MIFCIAINAFFTPIYERNNFQNCRSPFDTSKIHHPFKNSLHIFTIIIFLYFTVHFDQNNLNFVPSAILYQINHLFTNTISRRATIFTHERHRYSHANFWIFIGFRIDYWLFADRSNMGRKRGKDVVSSGWF